MQDDITIILSTPEALKFRSFQQFHQAFFLLVNSGVFDMKNGSCTIHFDPTGTIKKIERNDALYDSRVKNLQEKT